MTTGSDMTFPTGIYLLTSRKRILLDSDKKENTINRLYAYL